MEHDRTLRELGFKATSKRTKRSKKNNRNAPPTKPPNSTTLEKIQDHFYNVLKHPSPDAPTDTDVGSGHNVDAIEKGEEGFKTWGKEWREGYPR